MSISFQSLCGSVARCSLLLVVAAPGRLSMAGDRTQPSDGADLPHRGVFVFEAHEGQVARIEIEQGGVFTYITEPTADPCDTHVESTPDNGNALIRGTWQSDDGAITLSPETDSNPGEANSLPSRWTIIPWGDRTYLIPDGQILEFCNAVNLGSEPRADAIGAFPMRCGDIERDAYGLPSVPPEWADHLLPDPLQGRVERIDERAYAYLTIGGDQGLQAGMVLAVYAKDGSLRECRLKVVCPCESAARTQIICPSTPSAQRTETYDISAGDEVSTRLRSNNGG